jgi:hypothetical protein
VTGNPGKRSFLARQDILSGKTSSTCPESVPAGFTFPQAKAA